MLSKYKYHLLIFLAALSFSGISIFTAILAKNKVDLFTQVFGRMFFACILMLFITYLFHKKLAIKKNELFYIIVNGLLFLVGYTTYSISIFLGTPIIKAIVLVYTYPISAIILAYFILKEKPTLKQIMSMIISLISLFFLLEVWTIKNFSDIKLGDLFALFNGLCFASLIIWGIKIRKSVKMNPFSILFFSLIVSLPLVILSGYLLQIINIPILIPQLNIIAIVNNWLPLICLGIFGSGLSYVFLYFGSPKLKPLTTSIILLIEPVFVYLFSVFVFEQSLSIWGILGMIGIMISVLLV
jgi:drug/metabolite transporter, DME family